MTTALIAVALLVVSCAHARGQATTGATNATGSSSQSDAFFLRPGILPAEILRARGYLARDFQIRSQDGYWLRVTRGRNPLINGGRTGGAPGRVPILFVHGVLESFNVWLVNSDNASPSDLSRLDLASMSEANLEARLGDLPSAKSLALLALDCGHEVWIMSRRGFPGSQMRLGDTLASNVSSATGNNNNNFAPFNNTLLRAGILSNLLGGLVNYGDLVQQIALTLDSDFWNFSLDEQAQFDMPATVDFVRAQTGVQRIGLVAHSAGGAIALMSLSLHPELNDKLSAVILWSPAASLGNGPEFAKTVAALAPVLQAYVGPVPPSFTVEQIQAVLGVVCATELAQRTICASLFDLILGFSGGMAPMRPAFINSLLYSSSSHELAQFLQSVLLGGRMHLYSNFPLLLNRTMAYDYGRVTNTKLSLMVGRTDFLVPVEDVRTSSQMLTVNHRFRIIEAIFNHNGYFYHDNNARLAVIPTLREVQELSGR